MGKTVFRKAQVNQGLVGLFDVGPDGRILFDFFKCNHFVLLLS